MNITIDRQKKLMLLKWLKQGYIDKQELHSLKVSCPMTHEEMECELERLMRVTGEEDCQRLKRLGMCEYLRTNR